MVSNICEVGAQLKVSFGRHRNTSCVLESNKRYPKTLSHEISKLLLHEKHKTECHTHIYYDKDLLVHDPKLYQNSSDTLMEF